MNHLVFGKEVAKLDARSSTDDANVLGWNMTLDNIYNK
jgi:hypothetical protein